jgi:DHA3 family tetracycline resistance protein-like MFS transporter
VSELLRTKPDAYRLYLLMEFVIAVNLGLVHTTVVVYRVEEAGLSPLHLALVGTVLEAAYFAFQLPTGVLADAVSRRASVVAGIAVLGVSFLMEGLLPLFAGIAAAQLVRAFGFALVSGAQEAWIAHELESRADAGPPLARVYLRGSQAGLAGTLLGTVLSAVAASARLGLPLLIAGGALLALAAALALVMPETPETPETLETLEARREPAARPSLRNLTADAAGNLSATWALVRRGAGVPLLLGTVLVLGAWGESMDRLSGAHFLESFDLPAFAGLGTVGWFGVIAFVATLLGLLATHVVGRRLDDLPAGGSGGGSSTSTLPVFRVLSVVVALLTLATLLFALAGSFAVAIAAYWAAMALRPACQPLINAWLVERAAARARATALSAKDMFDSAGQFAGGPAVGAVGSAVSLRAAMATAGALLAPAFALLLTVRVRAAAAPHGERDKHQTPEAHS